MATMDLYSKRDANKTVKTRWGAIVFDANGKASHPIPVTDLPKLNELGWATDPEAVRAAELADLQAREAAERDAKSAPRSLTKRIISSAHHRSVTMKCRWGAVAFDADGFAEVDMPDSDLSKLGELGLTLMSPPPLVWVGPPPPPGEPPVDMNKTGSGKKK